MVDRTFLSFVEVSSLDPDEGRGGSFASLFVLVPGRIRHKEET